MQLLKNIISNKKRDRLLLKVRFNRNGVKKQERNTTKPSCKVFIFLATCCTRKYCNAFNISWSGWIFRNRKWRFDVGAFQLQLIRAEGTIIAYSVSRMLNNENCNREPNDYRILATVGFWQSYAAINIQVWSAWQLDIRPLCEFWYQTEAVIEPWKRRTGQSNEPSCLLGAFVCALAVGNVIVFLLKKKTNKTNVWTALIR